MNKKRMTAQELKTLHAELKTKYGEIKTLTFDKETVFLKSPTRQVVSMSLTRGMSDPLMQSEVIIENCYIGGTMTKEAIIDNVGILLGINAKVAEIIGFKTIELKNS